ILEDGQLCEIYIEREKEFALVGSIYKGRVTRVLPGMQSAFVDIGLDSDAFLYVGDFLENLEDYDHVVTTVEGKVQKMEQQGRELPPSKYASSRPYSPPGGQQREELPPDYEPVILPGESLAKYKDRIPRAAGTGSAGISASSASPVEAPPSAATPGHPGAAEHEADELTSSGSGERERQAAAPQEAWAPPHETDSPSATLDSHTLSEYQALPEEPPREIYEA